MRLIVHVLATAVAACSTACAVAAPNVWTHEGQDARHAYANPAERAITANNFPRLVVTGPIPLGFALGPISQGRAGVLYACSYPEDIRALDGVTGMRLWGRSDLPGDGCGSVAVGGDSIWLTTEHDWFGGTADDTRVMRLDAATGATRWQVALTEPAMQGMAGPTVSADLLVVPQRRSTVHALDARTGAERWRAQTCEFNNPAAIADGRVFVSGLYVIPGLYTACDDEPALRAYDAATGALLWKQAIPGTDRAPMAVGGHVVVVASDRVMAFDAASGALNWATTPPGISWIAAWAAVGDEIVVAGGGLIVFLDSDTGRTTRRVSLGVGDSVGSNLAVTATGLLFVMQDVVGDCRLAMLTAARQPRVLRHATLVHTVVGFDTWARVSAANGRVQVTNIWGQLLVYAPPAP